MVAMEWSVHGRARYCTKNVLHVSVPVFSDSSISIATVHFFQLPCLLSPPPTDTFGVFSSTSERDVAGVAACSLWVLWVSRFNRLVAISGIFVSLRERNYSGVSSWFITKWRLSVCVLLVFFVFLWTEILLVAFTANSRNCNWSRMFAEGPCLVPIWSRRQCTFTGWEEESSMFPWWLLVISLVLSHTYTSWIPVKTELGSISGWSQTTLCNFQWIHS